MTAKTDDVRLKTNFVVPALQRGLAIFELFDEASTLKISDVAKKLGLPHATAFRLMHTLETAGYIARVANSTAFTLTPKVLSLGVHFLGQLPITQIAQPSLRKLAKSTQAATHLIILDGHEAVHVARVTPTAPLVSNLQIGTRRPAHAVASGRTLLSCMTDDQLADYYRTIKHGQLSGSVAPSSLKSFIAIAHADRERGYVYMRTMHEPDLVSCASAVINHVGKAIAAIAVVGPRRQLNSTFGEARIAKLVQAEAASVSRKLGFRKPRADS